LIAHDTRIQSPQIRTRLKMTFLKIFFLDDH